MKIAKKKKESEENLLDFLVRFYNISIDDVRVDRKIKTK